MKKIFFLAILLCNFVFTVSAFPPELTKQQMYDDFDEFLFIIENANPQLPIRNAVTGINLIDSVKSLRPRIESINEFYEFILLLDTVLPFYGLPNKTPVF